MSLKFIHRLFTRHAVESQLRTVPPFTVGVVWAVVISYISFRIEMRGVCIIGLVLFTIIGYAIFERSENSHAR